MSARMSFGKFKGVLVADLPDDYLEWLHDNDVVLKGPLKDAVELEYAARFKPTKTKKPLSADAQQMAAEMISAGYRKLALQHHPDHGGHTKSMQLVNQAAEFLRQAIRGNT